MILWSFYYHSTIIDYSYLTYVIIITESYFTLNTLYTIPQS